MARRVNEYVATLVTTHPGRFGNFATVPLPDVDGAVIEAEYALDSLAAEGVVLLSNYEGKYLGDKGYTALWESLDARSAIVFIHPGHPMIPTLTDVPGRSLTTHSIPHATRSTWYSTECLDHYPAVRIILAHAGGFVPFAGSALLRLFDTL